MSYFYIRGYKENKSSNYCIFYVVVMKFDFWLIIYSAFGMVFQSYQASEWRLQFGGVQTGGNASSGKHLLKLANLHTILIIYF